MKDEVTPLIERVFRAAEARDIDAALAPMAPNIDFFDPHYPNPQMTGHAAVREGLEWGLSVMERFGFTIRHRFVSADGNSGAVEVDSNHRLKAGRDLSFPQVFVAEANGGLLVRLRAYEPYGPNGMGGFFLGMERLKRRITGRR